MSHRVVVVGSYNRDMVLRTRRIPRPGETVIGGSFSSGHGGKGANQAVAAARAGATVAFIGQVGDDAFGEDASLALTAERIDTRHLLRHPSSPTGTAWILVDDRGENSIVVASGANADLSAADICSVKNIIASADILLLQLESPLDAVRAAMETAVQHSVTVVLNPAPACPLPHDFLRSVTILTPNEVETEMLTGIPVTDDDRLGLAADALLEKGVRTAIITLGARGAYVATGSDRELIPGFEVTPVDTTAAGDVFNGVLAAFLSTGCTVSEAVRAGNAAGALCVMRRGAQQAVPTLAEIRTALASLPLTTV